MKYSVCFGGSHTLLGNADIPKNVVKKRKEREKSIRERREQCSLELGKTAQKR